MYGHDSRARDHLVRARANPPLWPGDAPDNTIWREEGALRDRRATEEEIQEDAEMGRRRAAARRRNEDFDEAAARSVRRRTLSDGQVLAAARQTHL